MVRTKTVAMAAGMALFSASFGLWAQAPKPTGDQFIKEAIEGNLAEIQVGQLAQEKGTTQAVKDFGATLVKDHQSANQNAMQVAHEMNVTSPEAPNAKEKATYDKLAKLSGKQFDRELISAEVKDHQRDIAMYKHEARQGNGAAASYAKETLPDLQKHLQMAEEVKRNEHVAKASGSTMR